MAKHLPVGAAQKQVLAILGEQASTWDDAERIFARYGILVRGVRQGRAGVPQVREAPRERGGWNPGGEDGWSLEPEASRLTAEQRAALAPYWIELS